MDGLRRLSQALGAGSDVTLKPDQRKAADPTTLIA
jgi:hypothetical protein